MAANEVKDHKSYATSSGSDTNFDHADDRNHSIADSQRISVSAAERARRNLNAKLANPLAGLSHQNIRGLGSDFASKYRIGNAEDVRAFEIGACLAQNPEAWETVEGLSDEETEILRKEFTNRWSQPRLMYIVIALCSLCAAVQGMGI